MASVPEGLELDVADGIVTAVLDRGEANLLTGDICSALTDVLLDPPAGVHVFRLSARGPHFCLGRERAAETPDDLRVEARRLVDLNRALRRSPLVSVAAVQGDAAGFGVGLAALCDLTVAAPPARFSFPEVTIDLAPAVVLSWLPRVVGRRQAFRLAATGEWVDAARAAAIGLVTDVASSAEALPAEVDAAVAALRAHEPRVHAQIRAFLEAAEDLTEEQAYELAVDRLVLGSMRRRRD